jgi:hypothetical protein
LMVDLRIDHERFGSSSDPGLNGHSNYPNDIDRSLNSEVASDKIRKNHGDYNNNPPSGIFLILDIPSTSGSLNVRLLFLQVHWETDRFFAVSGLQIVQSNSDRQFDYRHTVFSSQIKSKCGNILPTTTTLRILLDIDTTPMTSRSHTHPSHSQTRLLTRLLTSSLS